MAGTNTEKPMGKQEKKRSINVDTQKPIVEEKVQKNIDPKEKKVEEKTESKKEEKKISTKKVIKDQVELNATNIPVSTKKAIAICRAIQGRRIEDALSYLEKVSKLKLAVPMKGEIPHRKGKIMSGRYPVRAVKPFTSMLKGLEGNANQHGVEDPFIYLAIANKGTTTMGRGGRTQKKRTNIRLVAKSKATKKTKEKK